MKTRKRSRCLGGVLAAGTVCALMTGAPPALAATTPLLTEDFSGASVSIPPAGWQVENRDVAGMRAGWEGWTFHTVSEITAEFGADGDRAGFSRGSGLVAVVQSDGNRPTAANFDSVLWAPPVALEEHTGAVEVSFDSHYKQGQSPQTAQLVARFDGAAPTTVEQFSSHRLDEQVDLTFDVPEGTDTVQLGWSYLQSSNNWFWMIDDVRIGEAEQAPVRPALLSAPKPVAGPGESIDVRLGGLREGQRVTAALAGVQITDIPGAAADGTTEFAVPIPVDAVPGFLPLAVAGDGVEPFEISVSVLAPGDSAIDTTEDQIWFSGFDGDETWQLGGWSLSTREQVVSEYGTDRRHAFTRASGTIAVAEAGKGAFDGTMTSAPVPVVGGDALELRLDSHYRVRGAAQRSEIAAAFDDGTRLRLHVGGADQESAQLRLPVEVPGEATSVRFEFSFSSDGVAGSWMLDDLQLVRPLAALPETAVPDAVVDIYSDIQGANARLRDQVLPGFGRLPQRAKVIVANGDLVSSGGVSGYAPYFEAFAAGGGARYATRISTIGNHEYYGWEGSDVYRERFLDQTSMRDVGGQGGLWGETLVDGRLPVLWIGSEYHDYAIDPGNGPFVSLSDEQFGWLRDRLTHWREQHRPVLLFAHHPMADSVSGTYTKFAANDYGPDTARLQRLLSDNPNVTLINSHTHWSATLNDWSVEQRIDPTAAHGLNIVNSAAVTTQYGPSGDWDSAPISGTQPVGLQATLYEDRLRITAYEFSATETSEIRHVDFALPKDPDAPPALALDTSVVTQCRGGKVVLAVAVTNASATTVDATAATPFGTVQFLRVAPGKTASDAVRTNAPSISEGVVSFTGTGADGTAMERRIGYAGTRCAR